jgi:hypothetical protein
MEGKVGVLVNNRGYVKMDGMGNVPILEPEKYRKLPAKTIVRYMVLDRRKNGNLGRVIKIEEVNPEGYDFNKIKNIGKLQTEISNLKNSLDSLLEKKSESQEFKNCITLASNFIEEGNFEQAADFIKLTQEYCSDMIFKAPEQEKKGYSEVYKMISPLKKSFSKISSLEHAF